MKCSIVIPAYNDAKVLKLCLDHLNHQKLEEGISFEVIVVDDGSTDSTQELLKEWETKQKIFFFRHFFQQNKKQGAARNLGAKEASGDLILFIGADILVHHYWLDEHVAFHQQFPEESAIGLGFMTWSPELADDRFRQWLESSGTMLSYKGLENYQETDFWHFYTGNISMKKTLFKKYTFDEDFHTYGWEDVMLGYQMLKDGARLYYIENAKAWHHHALTIEDLFPNRMREIGKSAVLFAQKFPEVPVVPKGLKRWIFEIVSLPLCIFLLSSLKKEWGWYAQSKKYFLEGVKEKNI